VDAAGDQLERTHFLLTFQEMSHLGNMPKQLVLHSLERKSGITLPEVLATSLPRRLAVPIPIAATPSGDASVGREQPPKEWFMKGHLSQLHTHAMVAAGLYSVGN